MEPEHNLALLPIHSYYILIRLSNLSHDNHTSNILSLKCEVDLPALFPSSLMTEDGLKGSSASRRISKNCVKNFFTVVLILIYLLLTAVAGFLAYQTISEFLGKLHNPVMSVIYKEVDSFSPPGLYE